MNRTDRLYALVEELRATAPRPRSAQRLAERFEVAVRTIQRDLLALQEAGVPIWATPGPGGGYTIDPRPPPPPLTLNHSAADLPPQRGGGDRSGHGPQRPHALRRRRPHGPAQGGRGDVGDRAQRRRR